MTFRVGELVDSVADRRWGQVESVAVGAGGCCYGVRFANGEAAVRTSGQLNPATPPLVQLGSTDATKAATSAEKLTADMLTLKKVIEVRENYDTIMAADPSFVPSFEQMLQGWERFLKQASGANIAWYNLPGKVSRSFWAVFEGTNLFNTTQDYRAKFNNHYAAVQKMLGRQPTPSVPEPPEDKKKDKSPSELWEETVDKLVTGALIIGGVVGGGYLLLRLAGK